MTMRVWFLDWANQGSAHAMLKLYARCVNRKQKICVRKRGEKSTDRHQPGTQGVRWDAIRPELLFM